MVLDILEPQYYKIMKASDRLVEFIKEEKIPGGIFDVNESDTHYECCYYHGPKVQLATAVILLEDYISSFERQYSLDIRAELRLKREEMGLSDERSRIFEQLHSMVKLKDVEGFKKCYRAATDNLDRQYLEIRAARRGIFEFDILKEPEDFNTEFSCCDEKVNWDINEPIFFPESERNDDISSWEKGTPHRGSYYRTQGRLNCATRGGRRCECLSNRRRKNN
jgi:hypothetical protein